MPTGYTAFIEDGEITTGKEFLLLCSRAFGIATDLKDKSLRIPTPTHFEPSGYYWEKYKKEVREFDEFHKMSFNEVRKLRRSLYNRKIEAAKSEIARMKLINDRYMNVREQVDKWTPPTKDHEGIKKFALEQIDICIYPEKDFQHYQKIINTPFNDSDEAIHNYIHEHLEYLSQSVERAKKSLDKEITNAEDKTVFMKEFLDSLENI